MAFAEFNKSQLTTFLFFFWATGWLSAQTTSTLEVPGSVAHVNLSVCSLATDGSVLIVDPTRVIHCDADGRLLRVLSVDADVQPVSRAHFDPIAARYWVVTSVGSFFYDGSGRILGRGRIPAPTGEFLDVAPVVFMQLGRRLFVVGLDYTDLWYEPEPRVISQVNIAPHGEDELVITKQGPSFHTLSDRQISFNNNYKKHWMVGGPYHGDLFVANELSPVVRHFVQHPALEHGKQEEESGAVHLSLPGYKPAPMGWNYTVKSARAFQRWMRSWSRLTGFFGLPDGFLVTYTVPLEDADAPARHLGQAVNRDGKAVGMAIMVDGEPLGVRDGKLLVLRREDDRLLLHHLDLQVP